MPEADTHEKIAFLAQELGATLTAALSGASKAGDLADWLDGSTRPTDQQYDRLYFAHSLFQRAVDRKGEDVGVRVTRAWFLGGNVGPELDTPMTGIREDRFTEVTASLERMLEGDYFGEYCDESAALVMKYCGVFLI